uniref:Sulfotransferase n=1 Tax=Mola mola TaxID=94237 RepID=A0A3Q3W1F6_MOLML
MVKFWTVSLPISTLGFFSAGTIWMQEILPLLLNGEDLTPTQSSGCGSLTSPKALVSHFAYHLMPPSFHSSKATPRKVIYVMRNPKAIMVSSYYFHQMAGFLQDPRTFDEFMAAFLECRGPRLRLMLRVSLRNVGNSPVEGCLFVLSLRKMSDFLGRNLSKEVIQKIAENCSFKAMKGNSMSNFDLAPKQMMDKEVGDIDKIYQWLGEAGLRDSTEALIMAAQEQALNTSSIEAGSTTPDRTQGADSAKMPLTNCST